MDDWAESQVTDSKKIRIAILDDHQSIIDGYLFRLGQAADLEVVGTARFADQLEPILEAQRPQVLILDVFVPATQGNPNPFAILQAIPEWKARYPELNVLIISMHNLRTLIKAVMQSGASGYILKDDHATIRKLDSVLRTVAEGGIYFSKAVYDVLRIDHGATVELTPRQMQVLSLCAAQPDATTAELAQSMGIEHSTFRNLLSGAYDRLGIHSRSAAIAKAIQIGLLPSQKADL
jgi:two-component system nitrate/nitrite response regulator NarL